MVDEIRLWVPGLVYTTGAGDLRVGPTVGYRSRDPSLAGLPCGYAGQVADWTHTVWVVPRCDLRGEDPEALGLHLPESLVDPQQQPHAHRWLREQSLVAVSGAIEDRLSAAAVRTFRISHDVAGDGRLRIDVTRASECVAAVDVSGVQLRAAIAVETAHRPLLDVQGDPSPIDRLLRFVSNGVVDEEALACAVEGRRLVEEGYGYRGAPEGRYRTIAEVARALRPVDAIFRQVFARASAQRGDAALIVRRLRGGTTHTREVPVGGGLARAISVPELRFPNVVRVVLTGRASEGLVLPAEERWSVRTGDRWTPVALQDSAPSTEHAESRPASPSL